ncbi:MAG: enoyl-CoA hydratase/isomerase family protein [SAR86 cluster bacterium]|jgi:enoyl-CoA hydratase/carnithine racemase|nr:enoyl-CoA hydratase/isomerase family protein [SAR86 cluster bacterium]
MKLINIKKEGHICWASFNRPKQLNALNKELLTEIKEFSESLDEDLNTRVVIFLGKGKSFSSGSDLKESTKKSSKLDNWRHNFGKAAIKSILNINQITIAAINGYCLGGAACIASACDFRIASTDAKLGYPEINLGMNLNWLGLPLVLRLVGPAKTKRLVIGGQIEDSLTLLDWGFYDEIYPPDEFLTAVESMAYKYSLKPPLAAQMIKKSVNHLSYSNDEAIMHMDYDQNLLTLGTEDSKEAISAFFDKRDPKFTGN